MVKKNVPATVVATPTGAHLTLKAAQVEVERDDDSSKKSMAETIAERLKRDYFGR